MILIPLFSLAYGGLKSCTSSDVSGRALVLLVIETVTGLAAVVRTAVEVLVMVLVKSESVAVQETD